MDKRRTDSGKFDKVLEVGSESPQGKKILAWDRTQPRHKTYTMQCVRCGYMTQTSAKSFSNVCKKCSIKRENKSTLEYLMYSKYKSSAKARGVTFSVSLESFSKAIHSDCIYCGRAPEQVMKVGRASDNTLIYNGVDRIVCDLGYAEGNIAPCCWTCNQAKKNYSPEEFKNMITNWFERIDNWWQT